MFLRSIAVAALLAAGCVAPTRDLNDDYPLCVMVRFRHDGSEVRDVDFFGPGYCPYALEDLELPVSAEWKRAACLAVLPVADWVYEAPATDSRRRAYGEYVWDSLRYDPEHPDDLPVREPYASWDSVTYVPVADVLADPPKSVAPSVICERS